MDYPKFIVSNQKEESISIQWVNNLSINDRFFYNMTLENYFEIVVYAENVNILP